MRKQNPQNFEPTTRRQMAETALKTSQSQIKNMPLHEIQRLVHKLQAHQIELERQNEELRQTQLDLQQARDRYIDLYDFAPVGSLTLTIRGEILDANLTACNLLGMERKTVLHKKLEAFLTADDQPILRRHLHEVKQGKSKEISPVIRLGKAHTPLYVRLKSLYENASSQRPEAQFRIAILHSTEEERAKPSQLEREIWISGVFDTTMDGIVTIDARGQIIFFNKGAEEIFCCPASEAIGKSIEQFIPQRFRKIHKNHVQLFTQSGETVRSIGRLGNLSALRANGEEFEMEASISQYEISGKKHLTVILRDITEQKKAQAALENEQEFISKVLNTTGALVVVFDPRGRVVRFNQACEKLSGYSSKELKGRPIWNRLLLPEEVGVVKKVFRELCKGSRSNQFENHWVTKNKKIHLIAWSNSILADEKGKIEYIIGTGIDITERRKAEKEITRLLNHNALILGSAGEGIFGIDVSGKATFFNPTAEKLTGWASQEIQGKFLHSLLHHTKPDGTFHPWEECSIHLSIKRGHLYRSDTEVFWRKDGTNFPIAYTSSPIWNKEGHVEGAVVTFNDITERKKTEEALRQSEDRFQAFMNHSPAVAFLKDERGRYVYVNPTIKTVLHKQGGEWLGKTDGQLFPPDIAHSFRKHDQEVKKRGCVLEFEESTIDDSGASRHWLVYKFPVVGPDNQKLIGGFALDITSRIQIEQTLREREKELQRSQKELRALGGRLISAQEDERRRISRELHDDMNQRLAVLALNIQAAQQKLIESDQMFNTLQSLYDQVSSLSDDVRHLAYQLHPSILDDLGLVVALQSFVNDFSKWEGIPVTFTSTEMPQGLPSQVASCLYRITQESLRNVARHGKASAVDLTLTFQEDAIKLCIKDNGQGFDVNALHSGKKGLGLIGMQERMRAIQGYLKLESHTGEGTEVCAVVSIPPNIDDEKADPQD